MTSISQDGHSDYCYENVPYFNRAYLNFYSSLHQGLKLVFIFRRSCLDRSKDFFSSIDNCRIQFDTPPLPQLIKRFFFCKWIISKIGSFLKRPWLRAVVGQIRRTFLSYFIIIIIDTIDGGFSFSSRKALRFFSGWRQITRYRCLSSSYAWRHHVSRAVACLLGVPGQTIY